MCWKTFQYLIYPFTLRIGAPIYGTSCPHLQALGYHQGNDDNCYQYPRQRCRIQDGESPHGNPDDGGKSAAYPDHDGLARKDAVMP